MGEVSHRPLKTGLKEYSTHHWTEALPTILLSFPILFKHEMHATTAKLVKESSLQRLSNISALLPHKLHVRNLSRSYRCILVAFVLYLVLDMESNQFLFTPT